VLGHSPTQLTSGLCCGVDLFRSPVAESAEQVVDLVGVEVNAPPEVVNVDDRELAARSQSLRPLLSVEFAGRAPVSFAATQSDDRVHTVPKSGALIGITESRAPYREVTATHERAMKLGKHEVQIEPVHGRRSNGDLILGLPISASSARATTTRALGHRLLRRSASDRPGSTAVTTASASRRCSVACPVPAPNSTTHTPALSTPSSRKRSQRTFGYGGRALS